MVTAKSKAGAENAVERRDKSRPTKLVVNSSLAPSP